LCIYPRQAGTPLSHHQDIIARATHIASIAIERLRAEEELRRSETSLADGQRISLTGSFSWQVDTDELLFSPQLKRIFEFDEDATITFDRINERTHPDDVGMLSELVAEVRNGQGNPQNEIRLQMPDGRIKYVTVFGRVVGHESGRLECVGAVQDITARRLTEDALDKVRSDLAHVTRAMSLSALTASVAHEVNQPLSGIITNANTCLRMLAADPPNIEGALETARRTIRDGNRASEVITRLRALFSKKDFAAETIDLNQAAQEVVALCWQDLQRRGVSVQVKFDETLPAITGDRVQLQQVILNLLLNAADAMADVGGRPRQIFLETHKDNARNVALSVRDTGVGIAADNLSKVFDPFYTTKPSGMGIGLSVSRSIVDRHQGRLWAAGNAGPGATVSFSIPSAPATDVLAGAAVSTGSAS
jgi:signal transduction histidine kinase